MGEKHIENRDGKQIDDNIDDLGRDVNDPKRRPGDVDPHKIKPGKTGDRDSQGGRA